MADHPLDTGIWSDYTAFLVSGAAVEHWCQPFALLLAEGIQDGASYSVKGFETSSEELSLGDEVLAVSSEGTRETERAAR